MSIEPQGLPETVPASGQASAALPPALPAPSDRHVGRVPKSDRALRDAVLSELACDSTLEESHVGVSVEDGVVTLTGHVAAYPEKVAAVRGAERVFGVRAIADEIQVDHGPPVALRPPPRLPPTTLEDRLAAIRRTIDRLQEDADTASEPARSRLQSQIDALRRNEASTRSLVRRAVDEADALLRRLDGRVGLAEDAVAAELAQDRRTFEGALASMLEGWETAIERLQVKAAMRGAARTAAEAAIGRLRARRNEIAGSLEQARADADDAWHERKQQLAASADELCRAIDELSEKVENGGGR
jgi:BON domain